MGKYEISRRDFLRATAMAAAGLAAAACAKTPTEVPATATTPKPEAPTPTKAPAKPTATPTPEPAAMEKASPMIVDMVKSGALPPMEERLPVDVRVVELQGPIGKFGGTMHQVWDRLTWGRYQRQAGMFQYDMTGNLTIPDVAKGFAWSNGNKTVTLELRPGHKWSDGEPFTVDDIMFWWEDTQLNADLSPNGPSGIWKPGGTPAEFKKISDTMVEITFAVPAPYILDGLTRTWFSADPNIHMPKHYMEKWHAGYNKDAAKVAEQENFDDWMAAFNKHRNAPYAFDEPERPLLFLWTLEDFAPDRAVNVRNPYFHHVDPEGNQLPYIDRCDYAATGDKQVALLKASSGEADLHAFNISLFDMPVLKENAETGDFHVVTPTTMITSDPFIALNLATQDPPLAELFNTLDFRIALSIGVDRAAINDAVWFGLGKPHAVTPGPWMSYYQEEWATRHTEYDPDKANRLLDDLGLTAKDGDGFRLRPDSGERIEIIIDVCSPEGPKLPTIELVTSQWKKIGIKAIPNLIDNDLCRNRRGANEYIATTHHSDRGTLFGRYNPNFFGYDSNNTLWAMAWMQWFMSDGEQGSEPPQDIKDHKALFDRFRTVLPGTPEFDQMGAEYYSKFADDVLMIGTIGQGPQPIVVKNRLKNFPEKDIFWISDINFYQPYLPSQWWLEDQA